MINKKLLSITGGTYRYTFISKIILDIKFYYKSQAWKILFCFENSTVFIWRNQNFFFHAQALNFQSYSRVRWWYWFLNLFIGSVQWEGIPQQFHGGSWDDPRGNLPEWGCVRVLHRKRVEEGPQGYIFLVRTTHVQLELPLKCSNLYYDKWNIVN